MINKIIDKITEDPNFSGAEKLTHFFKGELLEGGGKRFHYGLWNIKNILVGFEDKSIVAEKLVQILKSEIKDLKPDQKKACRLIRLQFSNPDYIDFTKAKPYRYKRLETKEDFDFIIKRELDKHNSPNKIYSKNFKEHLISDLKDWKNSYNRWHTKSDSKNFYLLDLVDEFIEYLQEKKEPETASPKISKHVKPQTLLEAWAPGKETEYKKIIDFLKASNSKIDDKPFMTESGGKLYWNGNINGANMYLAGLFYMLTKKKWIANYYKSPVYKKIINNTFNHTLNVEPFKGLSKFETNSTPKYCLPFHNMPANLE